MTLPPINPTVPENPTYPAPAINPAELARINAIFQSSPISNSNFLNSGLPNWGDFVKYLQQNNGKMQYPISSNPMRIQYNQVVNSKSPYFDNLPLSYTDKEGRNFSYWEYPERVVRYHNLIRTAAPDWKAPDWLDVDAVNEAYEYLKIRNNNAPPEEWKALPYNDPITPYLQTLGEPPIAYQLPFEQKQGAQNNVLTDAQVKAQQPIDWSDLDNPEYKWMRTYLSLFAPQAEGIENRPELSKLSASAVQSLMLGLGVGVTVGAVATPVAGAIAGLAAAGLLTYQSYTGNKVPLLNDIMRPFNWLAEGAEATIGMASLAKQEGYDEVFDSLEDAYRTGLLEYETWKASNIPNWIAKVDDALRPNVDITTADKNEVWKISSGNLKPVEAPYGKGGEALAHYHQWIESGQANDEYQAALETGYDGRYQEFIYQRVMEEYGDTAISNDIVWQTVLDPLNVLPWAIGKSGGAIAGKIASTADNATVARTAGQIEGAFKQGTGNILIDALPPGIQQIAEAITGVQSSKGLLQTYNLYKDWIRTGFIPANMKQHAPDLQAKYKQLLKDGVKQTDISILDDTLTWTDKRGVRQSWQGKQGATIKAPTWDDLSAFEKYVGGLDEEYGYKELRPTFGKSFVKRLSKLTPEAQVNAIMNIFHHNIATLMDAAGGDPVKMTDLIERMAGNVTMKKGDPYSDIINSPANKAVIQAMQYAMKDGDFVTNMLSQWTLGEERRMMLNKIAAALEEKVSDVIEMAKDKPEILAQRMNKIAPELNTTPEVLKETLKVFIGDDALPWTAEQFQANLVNTFAQKMDNFFIDRYGLKPDAKVFRISNALKGVQSLVLLGFNPAYLMNNWINNFVTRSVDGVGGYLSPKQVNDFYTRFGIFPKDSGLTGYDEITGRVMREATQAKDMIAKAQKGITALNKIGIFSRLSGRIEKLEGGQARVIAIKDFMGKANKVGEGIRRMPLVLENALDSRYPGMKEKVYAAIGAGLNIKEIENSLFNTEVKPQVENMIDQLDQKYRNGQGGSVRELFDKMNLTDNLRDELMNAKTDMEIDLAFKNVEDRLTDWIEKAHAEELFTLSEESKNLTQSERIPYVLSVHGDMIIDEAMKHITGRQAWDVLYAKKAAGQFTPEQWRKEVNYLDAKQRAEMRLTNERRLQTYKGIIQAMGIENESSRTFVIKIGEFNDTWKTYWDERARLYKEFSQTSEKRKGETWDQRNARIDGLWEKLQEQQEKLYDAAVEKELAIQTEMDSMFAKMYEDYTGWDVTPAVKGRAELRKMREEMTNMQKEMRKTTKGLTPDQIDAEYAKMNPVYNKIIADMKQFEHDLSYKLMNKPVPAVKIEIPVVEKPAVVTGPEGNPNLEPITPADMTINPDNLALLKEEAINAGLKPELADGLDGKGLSNYINEMKGRETRAAKAAAEQAKIDKMKDVVKAKTVADDIFAQADRVLKEKATHAELVRNKADYLAQTRKAYKNVSEEQFTLFEKFTDRVIDRWAERNGYTPSDEIRNAWYATRIDKVTRETGNLPPEAVNSTAKGAYEMLENARAVITALEKADFSTMVHEMFHVFLPDLSDADIDSVAKLGGLKNGAELLDLMNQVRTGTLKRGMPDFKRYEDCVEQFARGGEQYIASGDAPTPALKSLFRKFSDWMLEIYQALTRKNGRVTGYENTQLKKANINVKVDGVSLKDVFDRMLTDKVDRPKSIGEMIRERINTMKDERGYRRLDEQGIQTAAGKALVKDILGNYKSADDAMKAADGLTDYVRLADGSLVDDAVIYDALEYMNAHPDTNPWTAGIAREARSAVTPGKYYTYGIADPERKYNMTYKVVDLNDLIASDNVQGNNIVPNPNFPQEYQGRITTAGKGEISQRMGQINEIARTLNPELLLHDNIKANEGAPVVTAKNEVLGGNGRVNSLQFAKQEYPDKWQAYQQDLPRWAAEVGIEPDAYKDMQNPVLVRELDPNEDAAAFAEDTNKPVTAVMTAVELAIRDAGKITPDMLRLLDVLEGEDIYQALQRKGNDKFINRFIAKLTKEERSALVEKDAINQEGTKRIVNALIATVFDTTEGERMLNTFASSMDNDIKTIQNAVMASLPQLALLEGQIKYGMKPKDFSIADDIARAANKIDALRKSGNMNAAALIDQMGLFGESPADTMTPVQKMLLPLFESKAPKKIREALRKYVYAVDKQPNIGQTTLSDLVRSKEQILNDAINGRIETAEQGNLLGEGQPRTDAETTGSVPLEELARPETEGGLGTAPAGSESLGGMAGKVPEVGAETPRPVESGEVQPAVKQPWEMTRDEYGMSSENLLTEFDTDASIEKDLAHLRKELEIGTGEYGAKLKGKRAKEVSSSLKGMIKRLEQKLALSKNHHEQVQQALSEGKPVPPEVLKDYPDLVAKNVVSTQAKAEYDAGQPVPIDRAENIDLAHEEVLPVSGAEERARVIANTFSFRNRELARQYLGWILRGEKGLAPDITPEIRNAFSNILDDLRESVSYKTRGIEILPTVQQIPPGIIVKKVFKFTHGDVDCVANVYKDGELIAYMPAVPLKDARIDENTRILGLDPQFPDKVVYEQDGVIKTVDMRKPEVDKGQEALFQNAAARTDTPEFKAWFSWDWINNRPGNKPSAVVNPDGTPMAVYHGSARIDRIAAKSKFDKNRATSGPMPFFTTDPEIASKYAVGKQDTSLANTDFNFEDGFLFKMPGNRYKDNLRTLWYSLDDATQKNLSENLPKVMHETTHLENIMYDEGLSQEVRDAAKARYDEIFDTDPLVLGEGVAGLDHWNYVLKNEARGNPIIVAMKIWLEGGDFIGEERRFLEVLRTAGLNTLLMKVETNLGNEVAQGVVPVHLSITNPLETHAIPTSVIEALRTRANKTRKRASEYGADAWDKNTRDPKEWVAELEKDIAENTDHVWTSIPDWVTETLIEQGYDGIRDRGGKYSGFVHDVWIPFYEAQVKSTFNRGTYDPSKSNMLFQSGQTDFFSQTADDLPLFSGTPMKAEDMLFAPKEASPQMSMFPDIVPEAKPTRIIEIQVKEKGGTSYIRLDLKKTKAIRDTLALHKGEEMTARILDANGKVVESNVDPNQVVNPTFGNALFQDEMTATKDWYFSQLGKVLETMPNKMTPEALRGFLNGKVKPSEMEWTGMDKWISQQEGQVTKQAALDYIAENQVRVEEVIHGSEESDAALWWNDEGGANQETPFDELTPAERRDALEEYRNEIEHVEGGTKYATTTLPGGENYRELLMTMPATKLEWKNSGENSIEAIAYGKKVIIEPEGDHYYLYSPGDVLGMKVYSLEQAKKYADAWALDLDRKNGFISAHWSEPNVLAHIRFDDRVDADGKRVLFIEEIQSDWHQKGREVGYKTDSQSLPDGYRVLWDEAGQGYRVVDENNRTIRYGDTEQQAIENALLKLRGGSVPNAPFSKNWDELAVKRMIRWAAENGYERVAFPTGPVAAKIEGHQLVENIDVIKWKEGSDQVSFKLKGDSGFKTETIKPDKTMKDYIGYDANNDLLKAPVDKDGYHVLQTKDISFGGENMRWFYEGVLLNTIKKYIKKWGATVGETTISGNNSKSIGMTMGIDRKQIFDTHVQSFDITPAMKDAVVYQGQPLFQDGFAEQPGGVEQFREYNEPPIDVQRMSDAPMGEVPLNGTPVTEPFSRTLDEINSEHLRPMMDELKDMYKKAMKEDTPFKFGDLADEDKKAIRKYLDNDVRSDLASVKRAALSYGDMMRNNAMLDYGRRYGFDNVLGTVFPYQFWYTRSMMNWAKRMVDKPSWFAMYARMKQTQERMEQENMPTRLRGKMRINMPWMPEWMGGGLWTDPMSKVFPFQQFGQPFEQYAMNKNQLNKAAEYIVEDMRSAEKITPAEAEQAISTKTGVIWERAMAQAEIEEGKSSSPASLVGMMMQPALWWQIPLNMANENRAETGPLPITRTGQTIKELGRNTFLQPVTNLVGGALAAPETAIRKSKGLSEFGQWGDYYIDRTIAGMAADGEITADQARIAMIERTGDIFAEATSRVSQEQALRTPGAAGIMALKSGKPIQAIPAFIGSIFGGSLFSEGELKMRGLKPVYDNAWKKFEAGDDDAINKFFEDYPEYEARLALYDEPEDRLHQFLIDSVWRKYMALDKQNKYMAVEALGEDFELSFLNKETRSYETISDKTLATWSQMLGKSEMPKVEAVAGAEKAKEISYYDQRTLKAIDAYRTEKESRFKNVNVWQEAYFALPVGAQRKAFLQQHPELKAYWDWKDEYSRTHPEIAPYFKELQSFSTGDQVSSELSSPLIRQILTLATGGTLSAGAKNELERIRMMYAPDMDEEQFIGLVLSLVLAGGVQ